MGYRDDDLAFRTRRDQLAADVEKQRELDEELTQKEDALREKLRRARLRLLWARFLRWMKRHPILTGIALLILGIYVLVKVEGISRARAHEKRVASVLGKDCKTRLKVTATPKGAVLVNELRIGKAPVDRPICPGRYLLRVVHHESLAWQRKLHVVDQEEISHHAKMISLRHRSRASMTIHTNPTSAVVYIDGKERGLAPVMAVNPRWAEPRVDPKKEDFAARRRDVQVGIWAPGHRAQALKVPFARDAHFHLEPIFEEETPATPTEGGR